MLFINYRREDSDIAVGRLEDALVQRLGREAVFRDCSSIEPGQVWPDELRGRVHDCVVMLAVIGPGWKSAKFTSGDLEGYPRLHDDNDWVRQELTVALAAGKLVVPIVLDEAELPKERWLDNFGLGELAKRQAERVRTSGDFHTDVERLVAKLRRLRPELPRAETSVPPPPISRVSDDELRRYLDKARSRHGEIQLIGFETKVRATVQLDDLYVPLDAMIDRTGRARDVYAGAQLAEAEKLGALHLQRQDVPLAEAFGHAGTMGKRGVIVLGDPGSGKTTHLTQVLLKIDEDGPESIGLPAGTVPVFLPLRELSRDRSGGLPGFIQAQLQDPFLETAPDFGQRLCQRGQLLFLLDGLDEVADAKERAEVSRWIEASLRAGPDCYFLVSCRYAGYTKDVELDAAFLELHLRPLTDEQMTRFVTNWYAIVERAAFTDPQQAAVEAKRRTKDLLQMLSETEFTAVARVYEMTRNPLLLTAICLVHRDRGRLPKARVRLYEESIKVLLERWRRKFPEAPLPVDQAALVLQPVASWMHTEEGRTRATGAQLREPMQQGLSLLRDVQLDAERFLQVIRDDAGLLTGWGMDEYGFMHLGFQEYLTARWLRSEGLQEPAVLEALATRFGDSWWQEVILLMLALDDPSAFDGLMRVVVRQPEFPQWARSETMTLALAEAARPSGAAFVELLRDGTSAPGWWRRVSRWWSGKAVDDEGLARRQLAAAELLARAMPEELAGLAGALREHPTGAVRQWWWARQRQRGGETLVTPGGVELVLIPGGRFWMGSPEGERGRDAWYGADALEKPGFHPESPHEVELDSFYMAKTPVTNAQYAKYLEANPQAEKPKYWGDRKWNQPEQPVVGVSWEEAQAYCEWAGLLLPTEAQWEYACRATTTTRFYSGDSEDDLEKVAWYGKNSGGSTHPVGQKEPNDFGLYDMHGNVWEWCRDAFGSYATRAAEGDGLRHEPVRDADRVLRGGGWYFVAAFVRSAIRHAGGPGDRGVFVGFRPAQGHP
ncbi:MAG: SUMF1/EgtB/PvdO family nonheme iron enzyme [Nannocystaceae bacterium]